MRKHMEEKFKPEYYHAGVWNVEAHFFSLKSVSPTAFTFLYFCKWQSKENVFELSNHIHKLIPFWGSAS